MPAPAPPPVHAAGFAPLDWALLAGVALTWGSSFLLIELGVDHFEPEVVALTREHAPPGTRFVEMPDAAHHLMLDQPIAFVTALRALLG